MAVTENQIVIAAEVQVRSPHFGVLEPIVTATETELEKIGVTDTPGVMVADAGYWHQQQMDEVTANKHIPLLIPPDATAAKAPNPGPRGTAVCTRSCAACSPPSDGGGIYRNARR